MQPAMHQLPAANFCNVSIRYTMALSGSSRTPLPSLTSLNGQRLHGDAEGGSESRRAVSTVGSYCRHLAPVSTKQTRTHTAFGIANLGARGEPGREVNHLAAFYSCWSRRHVIFTATRYMCRPPLQCPSLALVTLDDGGQESVQDEAGRPAR
jgi:hypothetical protein